MEDGLLSLKWNNHKTTFFEILKLLRDKANFTDATLAVEGKFFPVHKLVLSTCSEYFSDIFERTPCKSPVIVLKDVRSQDLESLLDYMYLGEVNVNQNDLALLLKTAECLRIKGLAVPDDDPTRHSSASSHNKSNSLNDDVTKDMPPAKRRKDDHSSSAAPSTLSPSRNSSSCGRTRPSSPSHVTSHSIKTLTSGTTDSGSSRDHEPDVPLVKVEMEENEDGEENFNNSDTNYETSSVTAEGRGEDFSVEKAEHDPSTYPNANFSSQHTAEMQWEDGENSFPQESFPGDSSSQQTGGDEEEEEVDVTSLSPHCNSFLSLSLTQSKEARRCQLCQVTLANANLLRRHVEDHHFHIRKYDCVHCGKKFKRKEHRERHERIHTGEKPFACHICSSRFTQKEHLKGHVENVHNKHMREKDKDMHSCDSQQHQDSERDAASSSPPSLASPSSLSTFMASSMSSILSSTLPLGPLSNIFPPVPSPSAILPSITAPSTVTSTDDVAASSSSVSVNNSGSSSSLMALYAPVTRKTVESPNRHVQTITINFN